MTRPFLLAGASISVIGMLAAGSVAASTAPASEQAAADAAIAAFDDYATGAGLVRDDEPDDEAGSILDLDPSDDDEVTAACFGDIFANLGPAGELLGEQTRVDSWEYALGEPPTAGTGAAPTSASNDAAAEADATAGTDDDLDDDFDDFFPEFSANARVAFVDPAETDALTAATTGLSAEQLELCLAEVMATSVPPEEMAETATFTVTDDLGVGDQSGSITFSFAEGSNIDEPSGYRFTVTFARSGNAFGIVFVDTTTATVAEAETAAAATTFDATAALEATMAELEPAVTR